MYIILLSLINMYLLCRPFAE